MTPSYRCEMYRAKLLANSKSLLKSVAHVHVEEVAYMLAGAICAAERECRFYVTNSFVPDVASEAAHLLAGQIPSSRFDRHMPLVKTAVRHYREFALRDLGGLQTLRIEDAYPAPRESNKFVGKPGRRGRFGKEKRFPSLCKCKSLFNLMISLKSKGRHNG